MAIELLLLEVDRLRLAICSGDVGEVLRAVALTPLPNAPAHWEGILNLRGQIIGVADIREILQLPPKPIELMDHLIVMHASDRPVAIRVDRALELVQIEDCDVETAEESLAESCSCGRIAKTKAGLVHIIDPRWLLSSAHLTPSAQFLAATPLEAAP